VARLVISADFQRDYARLERRIQALVDEVFDKFREHQHAGLHLERHGGQRDPRARTIRITDFYRGIVLAPDDGDTFILTRVLTHDEAERWMANNEFRINEASGALEVIDIIHLEQAVRALPKEPAPNNDLFVHRQDKDFAQLGVDALPVAVLRRLVTEDELESVLDLLPRMQAEALIELRGNDSVDEIFGRLVADPLTEAIDPTDVVAALERSTTKASFAVVTSDDELRELLAQPLALWRTYLHPSQRRFAYREMYNGPVRITGGPGTGKTVVAMHRVKALVDAAGETAGKPVLMTTFTRNLARVIESDLKALGGPGIVESVDVRNIDALAMAIVREHEGGARPRVAGLEEQRRHWNQVIDELGVPFTPEFMNAEWTQVVLAQGISSRDEYLKAARTGRGVRVDRRQRLEVWKAIEAFTKRLADTGSRTFLQLSATAAGYVSSRTVKPYRHVVVDEAQDLHEAQWRLIRGLVDEEPNDIFIVGDSHQRIYDNRASLGKVGIRIVGRSYRLKTCYRTTRQILRWSLALLGEGTYDDLDDGTDTLAGYHSWLTGPAPLMSGAASRSAEYERLVSIVREWIDAGVQPSEIGVCARTSISLSAIATALVRSQISSHELTGDEDTGPITSVRIGTMHRMKGLEFRCVGVVDVDDSQMPLQMALTERSDDELQHEADLRQERCLLYVACSRARESLAVLWAGRPSRFLAPLGA
jgi:superfamily I DNA/RNA helicase